MYDKNCGKKMLMFASISVSDIIQVENIKYWDKMEKTRDFFVYSRREKEENTMILVINMSEGLWK
ncbi:hypothetical protein J7K97_06465 [Candidatus Aerophobetes bacterium]|nr:hypothetical protein [Candidatus Aerophobetes bacterium]